MSPVCSLQVHSGDSKSFPFRISPRRRTAPNARHLPLIFSRCFVVFCRVFGFSLFPAPRRFVAGPLQNQRTSNAVFLLFHIFGEGTFSFPEGGVLWTPLTSCLFSPRTGDVGLWAIWAFFGCPIRLPRGFYTVVPPAARQKFRLQNHILDAPPKRR